MAREDQTVSMWINGVAEQTSRILIEAQIYLTSNKISQWIESKETTKYIIDKQEKNPSKSVLKWHRWQNS